MTRFLWISVNMIYTSEADFFYTFGHTFLPLCFNVQIGFVDLLQILRDGNNESFTIQMIF